MLRNKNIKGFNSVAIYNSLQFKVIAVIFIILLLLGSINLVTNYWTNKHYYEAEVNEKFSLVGDILKNDIERWMNNRRNEVITLTANPLVHQYIKEISLFPGDSNQAGKELEQYWIKVKNQFGIYDEIYFASIDGQILLSTKRQRKNEYRPKDDLIEVPLATGEIYFRDKFTAYSTNNPCIAFAVPVKAINDDSFIGVIVYRIDIESVLRPLLSSRVNLGNTGEIILINQSNASIMELRSLPGSAFSYILESEPALRASRGEDGVLRGMGYNGQEVISAYRFIPSVHWGLIVRQETSEIFSTLRGQLLKSVLQDFIIVTFALLVISLIIKRFLEPVSDMAVASMDIAGGNFSRRIRIESNDELGLLSESLNDMAGELGQRFKIQSSVHNVLEKLVSTLDMDDLLNAGLSTICESFDFKVGAVYLCDLERKELVQKASYCPGQQLIKRKKIINIDEGLEGLAVKDRRVRLITNLPDDTVYTVNWSGGYIIPECIITVPIVFGEEVLGVMTLCSLKNIDQTYILALEDVGTLMGVAIHNALIYQKTRDMSHRLQELNENLAQQNEELYSQGEELMVQTEELQAQSEELQAQSLELQEVTRELRVKNQELEKAGQNKSKFIATLSHELRAPLSAIISFSDVLTDQVVGELNQEQQKYLREIYYSGNHLLKMIDELLDFSKIEAGQIELKIKNIDPAIPLEEAMAMVDAKVSSKRLKVTNLLSPATYLVAVDQYRLTQVFLNLLTNAIKFTPDGGCITIGAQAENEFLNIWVSDDGIGIDRKYHNLIFEEFKQVGTISGEIGGTGLGLPITRKLLELQGGSIHVESGEGKGAKFMFKLPLAFSENHVSEINPKCGTKCDTQGICQLCNFPCSSLIFMKKPINKTALLGHVEKIACQLLGKPPLILTIDDDRMVRKYIQVILKNEDYEVLEAENGKQGLEMAISEKPDIIILDIIMPGSDGFEVVEKLSEHGLENALHIIILTSKDLSSEEKEYLKSKVNKICKERRLKR